MGNTTNNYHHGGDDPSDWVLQLLGVQEADVPRAVDDGNGGIKLVSYDEFYGVIDADAYEAPQPQLLPEPETPIVVEPSHEPTFEPTFERGSRMPSCDYPAVNTSYQDAYGGGYFPDVASLGESCAVTYTEYTPGIGRFILVAMALGASVFVASVFIVGVLQVLSG